MNSNKDKDKELGKTPWNWRGQVLPYGDVLPIATLYDANDVCIGSIQRQLAPLVVRAVNERAKLKELVSRYKGDVEELGRMLDDK
jgi:hypothetical protein